MFVGVEKESSVALSTCEAEYYAITDVAKKILWMRSVMQEFGYGATCGTPLRSDNQLAIDWTTAEQPPSARAKHIDVHLHFIRNLAENGTICVKYVPTEHNDADILTKPVGRLVLVKAIERIGLGETDAEEC